MLFAGQVYAQSLPLDAPKGLTATGGAQHMMDLQDAIVHHNTGNLDSTTRAAVNSGLQSANVASGNLNHMDEKTVQFTTEQASNLEKLAREAYVAALPAKDRALGESVMLGDGTVAGNGHMYIFVSRSMPASLLRAYAAQAFYMGATLVTKGIRRGETLRDFVMEEVQDFNNADGMELASIEINPDLFDMFDIQAVPSVVWSNRANLEDVGSGCQNLPDNVQPEQLQLEGPEEGQVITVDRPTCAKLPDSAYYKMTGALALSYVLDKFKDAGMDKNIVENYKNKLAQVTSNIYQGGMQAGVGNGMVAIHEDIHLDMLPRDALRSLKQQLETSNVQRTAFGPSFNMDQDDDVGYRKELEEKIRRGLGQ
ncbi:TrbC family F-type conjugative pilus assembly protein [Paraburkholderia sp. A3RO-2L]|uniref:TrbC family F-type conjugative pilus assembly protein n=1 Tax=unclassified Paraburkholderia TaxID=2615204 RepID=UPI003DA939A8